MWWLWPLCASAWAPSELLPLEVGAARALAATAVGGRTVVLVGSEQGVTVLDPRLGQTLGQVEGATSDLWTGDVDGDGALDTLACGPEGVDLLSLSEAPDGRVAASRTPISDTPCEALDLILVPGGQALVVVGDGALSLLTSSIVGQRRIPHPGLSPKGASEAGPPPLAASGFAVAFVDSEGGLRRLRGSEVDAIAGPPVWSVVGLPSEEDPWFAVLRGESELELALPEGTVPLGKGAPGAVRTLVAGPGRLWLLEAPDEGEGRIGLVHGGEMRWFPSPVAPRMGLAAELTGDDCVDLLVVDRAGQGALAIGDCASPPPVQEPAPLPLAPVPEEFLLTEQWAILEVRVGERLQTRLRDAYRGWGTFTSRGGPPGFAVQGDGTVEYEPVPEDVGRWRVSVRTTSDGVVVHWTGFELAVWPAQPAVLASTAPDGGSDDGVAAVGELSRLHPPSALLPARCLLGLGVAGGVARAGGSTWQNLGAADVRGGVSPLGSLACGFGRKRGHFVLGLDSAPYFRYGDVPRDRRHLLALSAGADLLLGATSLGVMGSIGASSRGLGVRSAWVGLQDWKGEPMGVEWRALWLVPKAGFEVTAAWVWSL